MEPYEVKIHLRNLEWHQVRETLEFLVSRFDVRQIADLEVKVAEPRGC